MRGVTTALRVWTLLSRFGLIFALARLLPAAEVGLYGLVVAVTTYVMYVFGFDLYTFVTREVATSGPEEWRWQVTSQLSFYARVYLVGLPVLGLLFAGGILPWSVMPWFLLIAPTEHVGFEVDRLLVAMSHTFSAAVAIAVRQGLLPLVLVPAMVLDAGLRDVQVVLAAWAVLNVTGLAVGVVALRRAIGRFRSITVDWPWVRRGLRASMPFLAGTALLRVLFTADRQVIAATEGLRVLGAYTVASSVGAGLVSVLVVGVHQYVYPRLVRAAHDEDAGRFRRELTSLAQQTFAVCAAGTLVAVVGRNVFTELIGGGIYSEYSWLIPAIVLVATIQALSYVPHFALYAIHADREILGVTALAVVVFGGLTALGVSTTSGGRAVVLGLVGANLVLLVGKAVAFRRSRPSWLKDTQLTAPQDQTGRLP